MNEMPIEKFKKQVKNENKGKRILAYILNVFIYWWIFIFTYPLVLLSLLIMTRNDDMLVLICAYMIGFSYMALMFYLIPELGKKILGLKVVNMDGTEATRGKKVMRSGFIHVSFFCYTFILSLVGWVYIIAFLRDKDFWRSSTLVVTNEQLKKLKEMQNFEA